ncbi:MAG: hypothetical protein ACFE9C_05760 [Candidatus Hodarchaeota archaeon]
MTQTLKKPNSKVQDTDEYYTKYFKDAEAYRPVILDYLFRHICFVTHGEKVRVITNSEYNLISKETQIPKVLVQKFISRFLDDLIGIRKFLKENQRLLCSRHQDRKVRIYLHKLYRLAPVFDYKRARENAHRLELKLDQLFFRPQIMTQLAIVIFITDLLDSHPSRRVDKIVQSNLRVLCSCSAYAFHRTRNKIGLTADYTKNLLKI